MKNFTVSVIVTTYQAQDSIGRALSSLLDTPRANEIEIIVIDDCSTDDTRAVLRNFEEKHNNIRVYCMKKNSGSPSAPRNLGIKKARADYVTFLDDDDTVNANNLLDMLDHAVSNNIDFLKGYLLVFRDGKKTVFNRITEPLEAGHETKVAIISKQSTKADAIIKRRILLDNNIVFPEDLKIGEDTVFIAKALVHSQAVCYLDNYFTHYIVCSTDDANVSSTQKCGDKEINDQISAWERADKILKADEIFYNLCRVHVGLRFLLTNIVKYSEGITKKTYDRLSAFVQKIHSIVKEKMSLSSRYQELYDVILSGDYTKYCTVARRRLLIAGYDLKFILPAVPYLEKIYNIRIDEWKGHAWHDEAESEDCAKWADIIWCEWLLGNAIFYANRKNGNQRLVIRAHRFEITREFGRQINYSKVDMLFTVGYYYFEKFQRQFSIPREKMRLLPNYVEPKIYSQDKNGDVRFNIGLVGMLPALKGFLKGLKLLLKLRERDKRFRLYVMGQQPEEVPWIRNDSYESEYFEECGRFIADNDLDDAVIYRGFVERDELYSNIGYILSLSDVESFHLALAEGSCAGCMGLSLNWPGAEFIYPPETLCESIDEIAEKIVIASLNEKIYINNVTALRNYVSENYGIDCFLEVLNTYLKRLYTS